jgi:hypothetical protein
MTIPPRLKVASPTATVRDSGSEGTEGIMTGLPSMVDGAETTSSVVASSGIVWSRGAEHL